MRREARRLYKDSYVIQDAEDKYFYEGDTIIHFGESEDGPDYRREFGFCEIKRIKLEDEECEDSVSPSSDDESEDEY